MPLSRQQSLEQTLSALIAFYPVTSAQSNVKALLSYVSERIAQSGLFRTNDILVNNDTHLLCASTTASKCPRILLQAHVDVVPADPALRIAHQKNGKLYGRGARDMLFATAAYLELLSELKDTGSNLSLAVMLNGDEEVGGLNTVPYFLSQGYRPEVVWLPDAGSSLDQIVTQAKGVYNFDITVRGVAHHGSRPWQGDNAALKLVKLLHQLQSNFPEPDDTHPTCTITQLNAGDSVNKGPAEAHAHVDIRLPNQTDSAKYHYLVDTLCKQYDATISNLVEADSYSVDTNDGYIKKYIATNEALTKLKVKPVAVSGSSDARYFSSLDIPVIMTRPLSQGSHSDDEWVDMESLENYYEVMKEYVLKVATIHTEENNE